MASSTLTQTLLQAVPDNSTVSYAAFQQAVGAPLDTLLDPASPQSLSRNGNHVTVTCAGASSSAQGVDVTVQKTVEFDIDPNAPGLSITNITGVKMKQSLVSGDLKAISVVPDANGDNQVTGKVQVSRFLPFVTFNRTVGADGTIK